MREVSELGQQILTFRKKHRLSQVGLAQGTKCQRSDIQDLERGRVGVGSTVRTRIEKFLATATENIIAPLRGPGSGNGGGLRPGPKLSPRALQRKEVRELSFEELDAELGILEKR